MLAMLATLSLVMMGTRTITTALVMNLAKVATMILMMRMMMTMTTMVRTTVTMITATG